MTLVLSAHLLVALMMMTSSSAGDDRDCVGQSLISLFVLVVFTALHGMQTRSSDENSVCLLSVCPSVRRPCDKTEEKSFQILIPYARTFSLVFLRRRRIGGGDLFYLKFWVKLTSLERNHRFSIYFRQ